eukprot:sb/3478862/
MIRRGSHDLTNLKKHGTVSLVVVQFNFIYLSHRLSLPSYSPPPYRQLRWFREDVLLPQTCPLPDPSPNAFQSLNPEPTKTSKQPIRTRYLGHVTSIS